MGHPGLKHDPSDLIAGQFRTLTGDKIKSVNPARLSQTIWQGSPVLAHVDEAVAAARVAARAQARVGVEVVAVVAGLAAGAHEVVHVTLARRVDGEVVRDTERGAGRIEHPVGDLPGLLGAMLLGAG